jgi:ribosome-associated protein
METLRRHTSTPLSVTWDFNTGNRNFRIFANMNLKNRNFESEFEFRTSRSGGAGGQHVNKTETRVELIFDVHGSNVLSEEEKERFAKKWPNRINEEGHFSICSSQHRSQSSNKEHVIKKFYEMLEKALQKEKKRVPTKIPKAIKENIRKKKKQHSEKKGDRKLKTRDFL